MKIIEIIAGVLRAAIHSARLSFIALICVTRQRRQEHALFESRTSTQTNLIDDRIIRKRQRNTSVVCDTGAELLI